MTEVDDFLPVFGYLLLEDEIQRQVFHIIVLLKILQYMYYMNRMRIRLRELRDNQISFENLTETEFRKSFHFSKNMTRFLLERLEPHLGNLRASGIPGYLKILATLNFLGHGSIPTLRRNVFFCCHESTIGQQGHDLNLSPNQ